MTDGKSESKRKITAEDVYGGSLPARDGAATNPCMSDCDDLEFQALCAASWKEARENLGRKVLVEEAQRPAAHDEIPFDALSDAELELLDLKAFSIAGILDIAKSRQLSRTDQARLLLLNNFTTREVRDALDVSESAISAARRGLKRDVERGRLKRELPETVTNARAATNAGVPRPDMCVGGKNYLGPTVERDAVSALRKRGRGRPRKMKEQEQW